MRFSILLAVASAAMALAAGIARAVDPACSGTPQMTINATLGSFTYCSPTTDETNTVYPLTGYPMECKVREGTTVLHTATALAPGTLVTVTGLSLRWEHQITIACSNSAGEGAAWAGPGRFPAAAPNRPIVVPIL